MTRGPFGYQYNKETDCVEIYEYSSSNANGALLFSIAREGMSHAFQFPFTQTGHTTSRDGLYHVRARYDPFSNTFKLTVTDRQDRSTTLSLDVKSALQGEVRVIGVYRDPKMMGLQKQIGRILKRGSNSKRLR